MKNTVTIKDIAKKAEVSTTTVSMALRSKGNISTKTRDRIIKIAHDIGYVRNHLAAKLRSKYSKTVGIVVGDISCEYTSHALKSLLDRLQKQDYLINIYQCDHQWKKLTEQTHQLVSQGVDGIFYCLSEGACYHAALDFVPDDLPIIDLSKNTIFTDKVDYLGIDHANSGRMATDYFINQGHRKVAYVGGETGSMCRAERISGYFKALNHANLSVSIHCVLDSDEGLSERIFHLLKEDAAISAVICHDLQSYGEACIAIERLGHKVGYDQVFGKVVSLICFVDTRPTFTFNYQPLFISADLGEIGVQACRRFFEVNQEMEDSPKEKSPSFRLMIPSSIHHK
ncbi:LacI family DNA-binding transcriptional regulator [Vibrio sp. E150_018]